MPPGRDFAVVLTQRDHRPPLTGSAPLEVGPWDVQVAGAPTRSVHGDVTVLLKGQVYDTPISALAMGYAAHGPAFVRGLHGAFSMVVLDARAGEVLAVTDHVGTHKLYAAHDGTRVIVSTRADHPEFVVRPYRPEAVAAVLAHGTPLNGTALYQGVCGLESASIHHVTAVGMMSRPYWALRPPAGASARPAAPMSDDLLDEYVFLLRQAVRRRRPAAEPVHLSLSGGHDSRGLLALLTLEGQEVRTFAYGLRADIPYTDAYAAAQLATQYGVSFEPVVAYHGDLPGTIRRNAAWGQGVTNFCEEADVWARLDGHVEHLFTGEHVHGLHRDELPSIDEQLAQLHIGPGRTIAWFTDLLDAAAARQLQEAYHGELERVRGSAVAHPHARQQHFTLMASQRLPHMLLPWRERFGGHHAAVHFPYLDRDVLEFIHRLPPGALAGKVFFQQALRRIDPQAYRVPLARTSGYQADWTAELARHRDRLEEELLSHPSRLDALVSPDVLRTLLHTTLEPSARGSLRRRVRSALGQLRHGALLSRVLGHATIRAHPVGRTELLLRALTLRALDAPG